MKTIFVVYTEKKLTAAELANSKLQRYVFNTEENLNIGDMVKTKRNGSPLQIVCEVEQTYKYYNEATGELRNDINSTRCFPIKTLVLREENDLVVHGTKMD